MRNYNINKNKNHKMWTCEVTDSYGNTSKNYFETKEKCMKQVYYIWENEEYFHKQNNKELLENAIKWCYEQGI